MTERSESHSLIYVSQCFNFFVMSPFHIIKHWNRIRSIRKEFFLASSPVFRRLLRLSDSRFVNRNNGKSEREWSVRFRSGEVSPFLAGLSESMRIIRQDGLHRVLFFSSSFFISAFWAQNHGCDVFVETSFVAYCVSIRPLSLYIHSCSTKGEKCGPHKIKLRRTGHQIYPGKDISWDDLILRVIKRDDPCRLVVNLPLCC